MKSILSILLIIVYTISAVFPQEDWRELTKLSSLISHYQEHSQENPDISFLEFWNLHYGKAAQTHQNEDADCHSKLPFKNHFHTDATFIVSVQVTHFSLPISPTFEGEKYVFPIYNDIESNQRLSDIWQPPKLG